MPQYDNDMQVIVSKVVSDNPKAPTLRVSTEIGGQKFAAGLWPWKRKDGSNVKDKNGNQQYIGRLEVDDYQPKHQSQQQPADDEPFDDDIPF